MAFQKKNSIHSYQPIPAADLSDGTMLTLGLLAVIHAPNRPHILCIEEPETGIHPRRLRWIFDKLAALAYPTDGKPPVQVLLTTHSPYLIDLFKDTPQAVIIVEQTDGRSRVSTVPQILEKLHIGGSDNIGHDWAAGIFEGV